MGCLFCRFAFGPEYRTRKGSESTYHRSRRKRRFPQALQNFPLIFRLLFRIRSAHYFFPPPDRPTWRHTIWLISRMISLPSERAIGPHTSSPFRICADASSIYSFVLASTRRSIPVFPSRIKNIPSASINAPRLKVLEASALPDTTGLCHTTFPSRLRQVNLPLVLLLTANR